MGRFLSLTLFLIVGLALVLHFHMEIPWLTSWVGKLPGDLVIKKGAITLYFPIASSAVISFVVSFLLSILFGKVILSESFIEDNRSAGGKIQTPMVGNHRDGEKSIGPFFMQ